jgi:hypothetical protein
MKFLVLEKERSSFFFYLLAFLFHIIFINYHAVNSDYMFAVGSDLISTQNLEIIKLFFDFNANTLGFSIIIYLLNISTGIEYHQIIKIISATSYILIFFGNYYLFKKFKFKINFFLFGLLILFNPLIWNYGFRSNPDLFSFSLAYFIIAVLLNYNFNFLFHFFFLIFLSLAIIIKPINGILILLLFFESYKTCQFKKFFITCSVILFFIFFYFVYNKILFGFYLIPPKYSSMGFNLNKFFNNFIYYSGLIFFLYVLFMIRIILDFIKELSIKKLIILLLFLLSIFLIIFKFSYLNTQSEITLGFLNNFIPSKFYHFLICFSAILNWFYIFIIYFKIQKKNNFFYYYKFFIYLILIYLTIISFFGPGAQRYLIVLLPFYYFIILNNEQSKKIIYFYFVIFFLINVILFGNFYNNNNINKKVINHLNNEKIIFQTNPGPLGSHVLDKFIIFYDKENNLVDQNIFKNSKYIIISSASDHDHEKILKVFESSYFGFLKKKVLLIKIN